MGIRGIHGHAHRHLRVHRARTPMDTYGRSAHGRSRKPTDAARVAMGAYGGPRMPADAHVHPRMPTAALRFPRTPTHSYGRPLWASANAHPYDTPTHAYGRPWMPSDARRYQCTPTDAHGHRQMTMGAYGCPQAPVGWPGKANDAPGTHMYAHTDSQNIRIPCLRKTHDTGHNASRMQTQK